MDVISNVASGFIGLFQAGGEQFMGWVTGIIPLVVCLMTAVNSIIKIVGTENVENFAQKITKYMVLRYTLLPLIAVFFLANPACYTFGRFLDEKYKPAFYDAAVSFVHPITGLFLMLMQASCSYGQVFLQVLLRLVMQLQVLQ